MKVITIVYDGTELPSDIISSMVGCMSRFVVEGSNTTVKQLNERDLITLGIKNVVSTRTDNKTQAVEHAANYISTRFGSFLKEPIKLILAMAEVKNSTTEESTILKNAVSIIVENPTNPILKQNEITPSVVKVIKEFNTSYHV